MEEKLHKLAPLIFAANANGIRILYNLWVVFVVITKTSIYKNYTVILFFFFNLSISLTQIIYIVY